MKQWKLAIAAAAWLLSNWSLSSVGELRAQNAPASPSAATPRAGQPGAGLNAVAPKTFPQLGSGQAPLGGPAVGNAGPVAAAPGGSISGVRAAIKCIHDIQLAAQADGLLQELLVEEGAAVEQGQLVMTIDERLAKAELGVAEKEAEAALAQANQDAQLRFSRKAAEVSNQEYLESKELYERNSASLQETRRKQLEAQKAGLGIEVAEVDHAKDIAAAGVAKEKVNAAKVQLELRKVTSPYDGIIVTRMRDQGEWVKAGEPILRLVHLKEMRVEAHVPVAGASVAHLQNANIRVHVNINGQDWTSDSKIEFVSPVIELNTCRIWARVSNPPIAGGWMLRDGMEATVDITFPAAQPVSTQKR
jgi:multidrug efflux pump subunit AcrA (membrane-fusion protein)